MDTRDYYVINKIKNLVAIKPYSSNPHDWYLWIVIRNLDNKFIVHTYNSQSDGYSNGDYNNKLTTALINFNGRGAL